MSVHESLLGYQWLYATAAADSTLTALLPAGASGICSGFAPPETTPPYVIFLHQAGKDVTTMNGVRLLVSALYQIKAVGPVDSIVTIGQIAAELDKLFKLASGSVTGGLIQSCTREQPLFQDEIVNTEDWTNMGGFYRLLIQQTS